MSERRDLTSDEENRIPLYITKPYYSLVDNLIYATFNKQPVTSPDGHFPWVHVVTQKRLTVQDFEEVFPNIRKVRKLDWAILCGSFKKKRISWSFTQECWVYGNNRAVQFSDSEEQSESEQSLTPRSPTNAPDSDSEQEQVSRILDDTTKRLTGLVSRVTSQPSSPCVSPGPLPSAPGPS
ncbi:hypothetical protein EDB84DRAFT_1435211 [Lactarius hengduanensis]|nr:hypothetical protein EDB84DRAFT_1435211 [Lactarius hengduanensis]